MAFKLYSDAQIDMPMLTCDVCGERIIDIWNDKATGSPSHDGQTTQVSVHHAACVPPSGTVTIALIDFLRLLVVQNRVGDLGSNQGIDTVFVQYPTGKGFETP
jgi:hypothetical protein